MKRTSVERVKSAVAVLARAPKFPPGAARAVQTAIRALPKEARPVLEGMLEGVQGVKADIDAIENGLRIKPSSSATLEYVKRDLARARKGFKKAGDFPSVVFSKLDYLYARADERLKRNTIKQLAKRYLWPLGRMTGRRGAPKLPREIAVFGADAITALGKMNVSEPAAARAVFRCLKPFFPLRSGAQFLRYLRQHKLLSRKQK